MADYGWTQPGMSNRSPISAGWDPRGPDTGYVPDGGGDLPLPQTPGPAAAGPTMPTGRSEGLGSWQPYENYLYTRSDTHGGRPQHSTIGSIGQGSNRWEGQPGSNSAPAPDDAESPVEPQAAPGSNPLVPGPGINGFLFGIK